MKTISLSHLCSAFGIMAITLVAPLSVSAEVGGTITRTTNTPEAALATIESAVDTLLGTYLELGEWKHESGTLTFTNGRIHTSTGCNTINASYTRNGFDLDIGPVTSTLKYCMEDGVMEKEQTLTKTLDSVTHFDFGPTSITLVGTNGSLVLTR
jgi:hypothetical protein